MACSADRINGWSSTSNTFMETPLALLFWVARGIGRDDDPLAEILSIALRLADPRMGGAGKTTAGPAPGRRARNVAVQTRCRVSQTATQAGFAPPSRSTVTVSVS